MMSTVEDKLAIEELIARYNQSLDRGDYETWLSCWADDAVFDGLGRVLTGIAPIREFANAYDADYRLRIPALKHFTVNVLSQIDGDRATSSSYLQLTSMGAKGGQILFTGRYEDDLKRVQGRWQFARRKLHQDLPPPAAVKG